MIFFLNQRWASWWLSRVCQGWRRRRRSGSFHRLSRWFLHLVMKRKSTEENFDGTQGLRIYNWHCGQASAGVDNLPSILTSATEATTRKSSKSKSSLFHFLLTLGTSTTWQPLPGRNVSNWPQLLKSWCTRMQGRTHPWKMSTRLYWFRDDE